MAANLLNSGGGEGDLESGRRIRNAVLVWFLEGDPALRERHQWLVQRIEHEAETLTSRNLSSLEVKLWSDLLEALGQRNYMVDVFKRFDRRIGEDLEVNFHQNTEEGHRDLGGNAAEISLESQELVCEDGRLPASPRSATAIGQRDVDGVPSNDGCSRSGLEAPRRSVLEASRRSVLEAARHSAQKVVGHERHGDTVVRSSGSPADVDLSIKVHDERKGEEDVGARRGTDTSRRGGKEDWSPERGQERGTERGPNLGRQYPQGPKGMSVRSGCQGSWAGGSRVLGEEGHGGWSFPQWERGKLMGRPEDSRYGYAEDSRFREAREGDSDFLPYFIPARRGEQRDGREQGRGPGRVPVRQGDEVVFEVNSESSLQKLIKAGWLIYQMDFVKKVVACLSSRQDGEWLITVAQDHQSLLRSVQLVWDAGREVMRVEMNGDSLMASRYGPLDGKFAVEVSIPKEADSAVVQNLVMAALGEDYARVVLREGAPCMELATPTGPQVIPFDRSPVMYTTDAPGTRLCKRQRFNSRTCSAGCEGGVDPSPS